MIAIRSSSIERKIKSLIPSKIKNIFLLIFINSYVGKLIKFLKIKFNLFGGRFNYALVSDIEASKIFFGLWESAEIRFSKRFAHSKTIIELGSCVGVTLGVLSNYRKNTKFICVEASKKNYDKLFSLKRMLSKNNYYIFINKAIAYGKDTVNFVESTTTGGKIDQSIKNKKNLVSAVTLTRILKENKINETFTLITDISGAEDEVFFKDSKALKKCTVIIAEIEDTSHYSADSQIKQLISLGFSITERYGKVFVLSNKNINQ